MRELNLQLVLLPLVMVQVVVIFSCARSHRTHTNVISSANFFLGSESIINGYQEILEWNRPACMTNIKKLGDLKALGLGEYLFMLTQQVFEFVGVDPPIIVNIDRLFVESIVIG